jgi:hypothetical protein
LIAHLHIIRTFIVECKGKKNFFANQFGVHYFEGVFSVNKLKMEEKGKVAGICI